MINLRFRPSLVVFVNEEGRQICAYLKQIVQLTQFDELLHQGIALIQVTALEERDQSDPVDKVRVHFGQVECIPVGQAFPEDEELPDASADLQDVISASINRIQLDTVLYEISREYPVPETRPQVYIVGNARSRALREIHQMIQREVRRRFFATEICYILDAFEHTGQGDVQAGEDPTLPNLRDPYWLREDVPNFCFFYEQYLAFPNPRTVTREESHYAAAESLFVLISTGITPEPRFENFLQPPPRLTTYTNVGSMNTTLLIFPREAALTFASARLGSTLVKQWLDDLNRELLPEKRRRDLQGQARRDVAEIEGWLEEKELRPGASEEKRKGRGKREIVESTRDLNRWPTLGILREENPTLPMRTVTQQQEVLRELEDQSVALFRLFHFREVEQEVRRYRKRPDIWIRLVDQRGRRAIEAYYEWDQIASGAWEAAGERVQAEAQQEIDRLWSSRQNGIHGFEMAKTYVDAFDEHLVRVIDHLGRLRVAHQQNYTESLEHFERLSKGEWLARPNALNAREGAGAPAQASPTGGREAVSASAAEGGGGSGVANVGIAGHQHLSPREVRLVDRLERRILWLQDQVPSIPTQCAISLPFLLALALASQALYPQEGTFFLIAFTIGVGLLIGLVNGLFWGRYWKKVREAKKDLLRFYCRHFAHRCEVREDALRLRVTIPLRRRIMGLRERLDNIAAFIGDVQARLDAIARRTQRDLFNTPSGARDIYVANGERLQRRNKNTLEDLAHQVMQQRENRPLEPWHRSLLEIKERLIETFRTEQPSILEMSEDDACRRIDTFVRDVTRGYLHGSLDNIQRALANSAIWSEARDRACSPLYQALVGIRQPQLFFVCGQASLLVPLRAHQSRGAQMNWPGDAIPVCISDRHDWVLFASFFCGGTPPALNPEILFPPRRFVPPPDRESIATETADAEIEDIPEAARFAFGSEAEDETGERFNTPDRFSFHAAAGEAGFPKPHSSAPQGPGTNVEESEREAPASGLNGSVADDLSSPEPRFPAPQEPEEGEELATPRRRNGLPEVSDAHLNAFLQQIPLHIIGIKGAQRQMEQYLAERQPTPAQIRDWERELGILSKQVFRDPGQARQRRAVQAIHGVLRTAVEESRAAEIGGTEAGLEENDDTPPRGTPVVQRESGSALPLPVEEEDVQAPPLFSSWEKDL
jgi:Asp-tRNA(Asn)/Glu-tRNA(Gln) amidotransferase C subunit